KIQIKSTNDSVATGIIIEGDINNLSSKTEWWRTGNFEKSESIIKLYLPHSGINAVEFEALFTQTFRPLTQQKNYWDYEHWYAQDSCLNLFFHTQSAIQK